MNASGRAKPSPQFRAERAQGDAGEGHDQDDNEPQHDDEKSRPARYPEPERGGRRRLAALIRGRTRLAKQHGLHDEERRGNREHHHGNHRHVLNGRPAGHTGKRIEISGEHQQTLRIARRLAEHQRQPEQLEAEQEHQRAGGEDRRQHHRQAHIDRDVPRTGAGGARRVLDLAIEDAQRDHREQEDVWHMGEPASTMSAGREYRLQGATPISSRTVLDTNSDCCRDRRITESEHERRDKEQEQRDRLEPGTPGQVGARHQKAEDDAERNGNRSHAAGQEHRGPQGGPEPRVIEDQSIGAEAELRIRLRQRRSQEALIDDDRHRHEHRRCGKAGGGEIAIFFERRQRTLGTVVPRGSRALQQWRCAGKHAVARRQRGLLKGRSSTPDRAHDRFSIEQRRHLHRQRGDAGSDRAI